MLDVAVETYTIYKMLDPRDGLPFYVGQTLRAIDERFQEHLHDNATNQAKRERITTLRHLSRTPIIEKIEQVHGPFAQALEREAYWIQHYLSEGIQLTNLYVGTEDMKRQTVYMPKGLAIWLKVHASMTEDDISGIITRLVEEYKEKIEREK